MCSRAGAGSARSPWRVSPKKRENVRHHRSVVGCPRRRDDAALGTSNSTTQNLAQVSPENIHCCTGSLVGWLTNLQGLGCMYFYRTIGLLIIQACQY